MCNKASFLKWSTTQNIVALIIIVTRIYAQQLYATLQEDVASLSIIKKGAKILRLISERSFI